MPSGLYFYGEYWKLSFGFEKTSKDQFTWIFENAAVKRQLRLRQYLPENEFEMPSLWEMRREKICYATSLPIGTWAENWEPVIWEILTLEVPTTATITARYLIFKCNTRLLLLIFKISILLNKESNLHSAVINTRSRLSSQARCYLMFEFAPTFRAL